MRQSARGKCVDTEMGTVFINLKLNGILDDDRNKLHPAPLLHR